MHTDCRHTGEQEAVEAQQGQRVQTRQGQDINEALGEQPERCS